MRPRVHSRSRPYPALFGTLDDGRQQFAPDAMSLRGRDYRERPISTFRTSWSPRDRLARGATRQRYNRLLSCLDGL